MKGYELIKEISDGKIKENTQIEVHDLTVLDKVIAIIEYKNGRLNWVEGTFDTSYLVSLNCYFKIIEEQEVDYWEEIANTFREYGETLAEKFAKIGRQLDKKIKEKE